MPYYSRSRRYTPYGRQLGGYYQRYGARNYARSGRTRRYGPSRSRASSYRLRYYRAKLRSALQNRAQMAGMRMQSRARRLLNVRTAGYLGIEHKFVDSGDVQVAVPSNATATGGNLVPSTFALNSVAQGTGPSQREGRRATFDWCEVKGIATIEEEEGTTQLPQTAIAVFYLILDTQTNGTALDTSSVFTNPSASAGNVTNIFLDLDNSLRYRILAQQVVVFPPRPLTIVGTGPDTFSYGDVNIPVCLKWKGQFVTNFDGTDGTVDEITDNSLWLVGFSNVSNLVLFSYNWRMRYRG